MKVVKEVIDYVTDSSFKIFKTKIEGLLNAKIKQLIPVFIQISLFLLGVVFLLFGLIAYFFTILGVQWYFILILFGLIILAITGFLSLFRPVRI